jgi:putative transposase
VKAASDRSPPSQPGVDGVDPAHPFAAPTYGSPRVHQQLLAEGHQVGRHRVARLMREQQLRARRGRVNSRPSSAPPSRAPQVKDLVQRRFKADAVDQLWCADVTPIATGEGWLYAAVVIDVFSRRIISWAVSRNPAAEMSLTALKQAITQRRPPPRTVVHSGYAEVCVKPRIRRDGLRSWGLLMDFSA